MAQYYDCRKKECTDAATNNTDFIELEMSLVVAGTGWNCCKKYNPLTNKHLSGTYKAYHKQGNKFLI